MPSSTDPLECSAKEPMVLMYIKDGEVMMGYFDESAYHDKLFPIFINHLHALSWKDLTGKYAELIKTAKNTIQPVEIEKRRSFWRW